MYFESNDITMYFKKYGSASNSILILPGWGDNRQSFNHIINYLINDYSIYIFDYPGFGNSKIPDHDLTIYDYANWFKSFLKNYRISNPIIICHSFGGRIATILAGLYKEKINRIIMMDGAPIKIKKNIYEYFREKFYKILKKLGLILPKKYIRTWQEFLIRKFGSSDYKNLPIDLRNTFKNIIAEDLTGYLKYILCPTLLIWGENDRITPLKYGYKIKKKIKDCGIVVYPRATHFSYLEYPLWTNLIISEFIKK